MNIRLTIIRSLSAIFITALSACILGIGGNVDEMLDSMVEETNSQRIVFTLINNGTAYSVSSNGKLYGPITIPASYNDKSVTRIGNSAFYGCSGLTSITIPSSVTSIGSSAFYYCDILTRVFYGGADSTAWDGIYIDSWNDNLIDATRYYYSATHPGTVNTHWRFVNGVPTVWN